MMPRVGRGGRQTWMAAVAFGAALLAGWVGSVAAAVFDTPPTLGDRRVELTWQPDADDPVYNGNTVLGFESRFTAIHAAGRAVGLILSSSDGSMIYSAAAGESALRGWGVADGRITIDLPLGPPGGPAREMPVALAMHASNQRILGAFPNGDFGLWRLDNPGPPEVISGSGGVRTLLFYPGLTDTAALQFVSVGTDDTLRVWRRPGEPLGRRYSIFVSGGTTGALDITLDRKVVAIGTRDGEVRVYNIETPPDTPFLRLTGHNQAVTGVTFTKDRSKLASVDTSGRVCLWKIPEGTLLTTLETGAAASSIAFTPPDGRILFVVMANGRLDIRSGNNGAVYRSERVPHLPEERIVTQSILTSDGVRTVVGDDDGGVTVVRAGPCRPGADQPSCFGGYKIWRSPTRNIEDRKLMRIYDYTDSTWTFRDSRRAFSDPDSIIRRKNPPERREEPMGDYDIAGPPNGVPYYYSITRFDWHYQDGGLFPVFSDSTQAVWNGFYRDHPGDPPTPLMAAAPGDSVPPLLAEVIVVPNPFAIDKWDVQWGEPHVEFRNLPETATIRIYTLAGDLVRVIEHGRGRYQELRDASAWDFLNFSHRRVTSGVYVYQVVTPATSHLPGEVAQGYFTVVF